jgi:hypothetical protein
MPEPWEVEFEYLRQGSPTLITPAIWRFVILNRLSNGDLRPIVWAIRNEGADEDILDIIVELIEQGHVILKPRNGRPGDPDKIYRAILIEKAYNARTDNSEKAFDAIAADLGRSHQSIRQSITFLRKLKKSIT